jgi:glycosyltransferase involved in cell wall biosynthesis
MDFKIHNKVTDDNPDWETFWDVIRKETMEVSSDIVFLQVPLVSVWMITYNHASYIAQAIDSVLRQIVDFPIELVIGDDSSTDGTCEIIAEYQQKFPQMIRVLNSQKNLGSVLGKKWQPNVIRTLSACRGKFIALLEGDDWWTSERKLAEQVALLERTPLASACYSECYDFVVETGERKFNTVLRPDVVDVKYILKNGWFIRTPTIIFRANKLSRIPFWYLNQYSTDYLLQLWLAENGPIVKLPYITSCYRRHEGGVSQVQWDAQVARWIDKIELLKLLDNYFGGVYKKEIQFSIKNIHANIFVFQVRNQPFSKRTLVALRNMGFKKLFSVIFTFLRNRVKRIAMIRQNVSEEPSAIHRHLP